MRNGSNQIVGTFTKAPVPIGAGGYVVNIDQSSDGSRLIHGADVGSGGYIRNLPGDVKWTSMMSTATLLPSEYDPQPAKLNDDGWGMLAMRIAPSNKDVIYCGWGGRVFKSTDGGLTQRRTSLGDVHVKPNYGYAKFAGPMIDVHPTNASRLMLGAHHFPGDTSKSGAFYSLDGGATAKVKIAGLPAATPRPGYTDQPGRTLVLYDPGNPLYCYVHVDGTGLYVSTAGETGTFSFVTGSPLYVLQMDITAAGTLYSACGGPGVPTPTNDVYKRTRAGVASYLTSGNESPGAACIAVDPFDSNRIVVGSYNGHFAITYNGGTSWELLRDSEGRVVRTYGEIEWLSNNGAKSVFNGKIMFDRATQHKMWLAHGTGVAWTVVPTAPGGILDLHDFSKGNEEKVSQSFLSVPGNAVPILGNWDYSIWPMYDLKQWTNRGIIPTDDKLLIAEDLDYAIDDTSYYVCALAQKERVNSYSTDKGRTWANFPNQGAFGYGSGAIAVSNKNNVVILGTNNSGSFYTLNGGTTWNPLQLVAGVTTPNMIGAEYISRKVLTSDKTRPGVFSVIVPGPGGGARSDTGLYCTLDGGVTWTKKISGILAASINPNGNNAQYYRETLRYIPGFSGEMLHTVHGEGYTDWLHWIKNDGATIERLGSTTAQVLSFDFGPVLPGQTRPCVGFFGEVNGVSGVYISTDWFATTPMLISRFPLDNLSDINIIGMDRNQLRIFVGGIGWVYFDYADVATAT